MNDRDPEDDHNKIEYHSKRIDEIGIEAFEKTSGDYFKGAASAAALAKDKYYKDQKDTKNKSREKLDMEAHIKLYEQVQIGKWQNFLVFVGIVVAIWIAVAD